MFSLIFSMYLLLPSIETLEPNKFILIKSFCEKEESGVPICLSVSGNANLHSATT